MGGEYEGVWSCTSNISWLSVCLSSLKSGFAAVLASWNFFAIFLVPEINQYYLIPDLRHKFQLSFPFWVHPLIFGELNEDFSLILLVLILAKVASKAFNFVIFMDYHWKFCGTYWVTFIPKPVRKCGLLLFDRWWKLSDWGRSGFSVCSM